ncbi:MAG: DUF952 domain-containing protein [Rhizobiaceae bacterium]|nr:DUF952 domain-containing protein [Rhizobiaceae bacterium]
MTNIYKIVTREEWVEASAAGVFTGAPIDHQDGYIHFSTAGQVRETAAKHFHGRNNLLLVTVNADTLGTDLKWESSRGGDLFPHLYSELPVSLATAVQPLEDRPDGSHKFPEKF